MITKTSVVKTQNLIVNNESRPIKSNPGPIFAQKVLYLRPDTSK